jgi:threonine/homoserine/homoserine lactone efflux protein
MVIGFLLAAPVGPLGLLCIQRTLERGFSAGVFTGLGVAFADAVYGMIAAFGLTVVSEFLMAHQSVIAMSGGVFLGWLGFRTLLNSAPKDPAINDLQKKSFFGTFASAFALTLANPMTILAYVAIFSTASIAIDGNHASAITMTLAIFAGSLLWWLILSTVIAFTRSKIGPRHLSLVNKCSGVLILGFALYVVIPK